MSAYGELPGFEHLYLEDSWVIDIRATPSLLELTVDLVLRETHPAYAQPGPGEQHCYRAGVIRFAGVSTLSWDGQGRPAAVDATGTRDYGSIDSLEHDGEVSMLRGDFGTIQLRAASLPEVVLL